MQISIKKFFISTFICAVFTVTSVFAIEDINIEKDKVLTMSDCIKIALKNSPVIKKQGYNYKVAKSNVGVAKAGYFPTLSAGTGYNFTSTSADKTSSDTNIYNVEASLNQLIWNFGRTNARIRMQKFNMISALYNFDNSVINSIFEVKTNYYAVLAARATLDINRAYVDINERNYQRTKAYFDEGIKSKIDLVNSEVNLSQSKVALVDAEKAYKNAMVKLNNSMYVAYAPEYEISQTETFNFKEGLYIVNLKELDKKGDLSILPEDVDDATMTAIAETTNLLSNYKFEEFPYTFEEAVEIAYKNRPDLKAFESTYKAMKENVKYVRREFYPSISAKAGYGFRNQNNTNSFNVGVNATSTLNIMGKKNEIDVAKYQVDLAQNEIDLLKQNIYFEVQNLYINMIELEKQVPLISVKVRQTLENFELADGRYYVGLGDYIELQDAKVQYNNAQHSYVEIVYKYNVARAALEKAMALPQQITLNIEDLKK